MHQLLSNGQHHQQHKHNGKEQQQTSGDKAIFLPLTGESDQADELFGLSHGVPRGIVFPDLLRNSARLCFAVASLDFHPQGLLFSEYFLYLHGTTDAFPWSIFGLNLVTCMLNGRNKRPKSEQKKENNWNLHSTSPLWGCNKNPDDPTRN